MHLPYGPLLPLDEQLRGVLQLPILRVVSVLFVHRVFICSRYYHRAHNGDAAAAEVRAVVTVMIRDDNE